MDQQQSMFDVKDMLGNAIRPGTVLLYPKGNEIKLAVVDEINACLTRSSPNAASLRLNLVGKHGHPGYITGKVSITNPAKYIALEATPEVPATATTPAQPAGFRVPQAAAAAAMLIGSAIN